MASEKNLKLKRETVSTIVDKIKQSETVIIFAYQGLSVADVSGLRRKLRDESAEIKVYKNTLVKLALDELKLDLTSVLDGPNAILFSKELLAAIKVLSTYAKDHPNLNIRAGIIKGDVVGIDTINEYASIPSMEGLLTMLAGGMIEHVKNLSIALNLYAEDLNGGDPVEVKTEAKPEETPEVVSEEATEAAPSAEETPVEAEAAAEEAVVEEEVASNSDAEEKNEEN